EVNAIRGAGRNVLAVAGRSIAGNHVPRAGGGATDEITGRTVRLAGGTGEQDAFLDVGECAGAILIGADVVSQKTIGADSRAFHQHAIRAISGNDVSRFD